MTNDFCARPLKLDLHHLGNFLENEMDNTLTVQGPGYTADALRYPVQIRLILSE